MMNRRHFLNTSIAACSLHMLPSLAQASAQRIVSIGGSVTEIVFALGQQDRLIARDRTSSFPAQALDLPDVGYIRALSPEGVLSVSPDLLLTLEGAGPPEAIQVLQSANVNIATIPDRYDAKGVIDKILAVGKALETEAAAKILAGDVKAKLDGAVAQANASPVGNRPRVLFILSAQGGRIMAAGRNSSAAGIIEMAGGDNAMQGFEGYKPVTNEALISAAPDVVLMMDRSGNHAISDEDLFAIQALSVTPAGRDKRIVRMNGLHLLGFGPRTASAVTELSTELHKAPL
jgi:iron complex transport system substrate-binding protein